VNSRISLVRFIKLLHELGSVGLMGGVAAVVVFRWKGPGVDRPGYFELCHAIDALYTWVIIPSMLLCVASGVASMIVHTPYWNALWAWAKAGSGIVAMNFGFRMQGYAAKVSSAEFLADRAELADAFRTEWSGLWVLLVVSLLNIVVGIWRPKLRRLTGPAR
jgi:hypothetical protein